MFTGIVQGLKPILQVEERAHLRRLVVALDELAEGLALGASVAVNGTCLTVTAVDAGAVSFDVIAETLSLTNLGALRTGTLVNVERSFRVGEEVGGHLVSGHISGTAVLERVDERENERNLFFRAPPDCMKYLLHKGFVALDGASLTLATVDRHLHQVSVCLIPETIARTTLGRVKLGDRVNLEVDAQTQAIVDTVERVLADRELHDRLVR
ncbi:MAG: riboflavin synthase subunit alpha [Pseudomonadales bacterium]